MTIERKACSIQQFAKGGKLQVVVIERKVCSIAETKNLRLSAFIRSSPTKE